MRRNSNRICKALFLLIVFVLLAAGHEARAVSPANETVPSGTIPPVPKILISEFLADNETNLKDEDGDTSDWIEVYNQGTQPVDLEGWALTDRADDLMRWRFPAVTLEPGGYLLVFASDKDRQSPGRELHTNFKLRRDGEFLALVNPAGEVVSSYAPSFPAQLPDISYGTDSDGIQRYFPTPTPGASNDVEGNLGPLFVDISHGPTNLYTGMPLTVDVAIQPGIRPVKNLDLHYRIGFGPEVRLPMVSTGAANDGTLTFSAELSPDLYSPGDLVRFYVLAYDSENRTSRWPIFGSPLNSPRYEGTMVLDPDVITKNPVLYWFVQDTVAAATEVGARATVFYDGILYDNVLVRKRGDTSAANNKPSYKFVFNDGHHLRLAFYQLTVDEINLDANVLDSSYLRATLAWESFRDAGSPYSISFPVRIQRNGEFYGLYSFVEQPDRSYFERQDLDWDGALYKMVFNDLSGYRSGYEKRTRKDENNADLQAFVTGINQTGGARERYLFDHVNLPAVINYLAVNNIVQEWDFVVKNYYLYRDSEETGEWMFLAWDKDFAFSGVAPSGINSHPFHGSVAHPAVYPSENLELSNRLIEAVYTTPRLRAMYLRRLRSLMDLLLQPKDTPVQNRYYESRIEELKSQVQADAQLDAERWNPVDAFSASIAALQSQALTPKRTQLYDYFVAEEKLIPGPQHAAIDIDFGEIDNRAAGEDEDAEYFVLYNPNAVAVDISGWRISGDVDYVFQAGVVIPAGGRLYVAKDVAAFRGRSRSPKGGEGLFVQGGYKRELSDQLGSLQLRNQAGELIDRTAFWREGEPRSGDVYLPLIVNR